MDKIKLIFKKLFSGRLRRLHFFIARLILIILMELLAFYFENVNQYFDYFISVIFGILIISLEIRRLHDINLPGFISVIAYLIRTFATYTPFSQIIVIIGYLYDIFLVFYPGSKEVNKYGEQPKGEKTFVSSIFNY
jgi:uncharacterized membrane protein YhaH (DUF805 family)